MGLTSWRDTYPRTLSAMRPVLSIVLAALAVGGPACGSDDEAGLASAPPLPAARLAEAGGQLLGGGVHAFRRQLRALRGTPVVVNQWASWCGPCRFEFPFFRRLAVEYRGRVAFLGVDAQDSREAAEEFLRENPVPFPSFFDPQLRIAREVEGGVPWPTTAFLDRRGRVVDTHAGAYRSQDQLEDDVRELLGA
jgi:cytochrome c biogenesis protein CcmG/thiol:disulfide interchange protein DsbE